MSGASFEWKSRAAFAEFAEPLKIETVEIMAAQGSLDAVMVIYSPGVAAIEPDDDDAMALVPVRRAILKRDPDDVLVVVADDEVGTLGEFQAQIDELMLNWTGEQ